MTDAPSQSPGQSFIPPSSSPTAPTGTTTAADKPTPPQPVVGKAEPIPLSASAHGDQLARIEDKAARIEDKYARSEALLSRVEEKVEGATTRMNESARQADLAALRSEVRGINERVRKVPGTGALVLTAIITSVLTVVLLVAVQRLHLDTVIPQRNPAATPQ